ncbi:MULTISPECIES: hypothetical protein [Arthrospira]|jgi:hypothetical protein|uniref:Uncharacterized protein n=1 Tax=Limnospira platensis NIES-46 TaxID=1236695 RepID=A0A5M3T333_LIMPL|nr:hypothetical protein [Arthrospira platensis]AMW27450.1 hypothetical protein AP285_05100 [Arthrospira platensis YZ]KDR58079.1 hypothetical protein APPUASWS_007350 [Arthrospira platensis str. Paraca]MBD2668033.1 hypothetical protein [Arthrospira platensis FACHB-439]MBD2709950.1 hypothetical protein [Arthrospira platensis FACHB-835]MDF2210972.1 hypothetical protein [Arthrospira platensis NCB002]MDT9182474.1 hypothetical protein [Limnospira sp. PMC 289.06]MDT9295622.1 hypothetical protein [Ar
MNPKIIDVSGLTPQQITVIEEVVAAFKLVARQKDSFSPYLTHPQNIDRKELEELEREFDWLVADIGAKDAIARSDIYGIN